MLAGSEVWEFSFCDFELATTARTNADVVGKDAEAMLKEQGTTGG